MRARVLACCVAAIALAAAAAAYPEFQVWSQANSGRNVNCSMCHAHPDGPEGLKPGQIGALNAAQLKALNDSRLAFEPGTEVQSPILNDFGDSIVQRLGRREFISLRLHPGQLAAKLDPASDLDNDGIPDEREYREGTHPLNPSSGSPWLLLKANLFRQKFHIAMILLATIFGLYGIHNLLNGLAGRAQAAARRPLP